MIAKGDKAVAIVALQPVEGGQPDVAILILGNGLDVIRSQCIGNGKVGKGILTGLLVVSRKPKADAAKQQKDDTYQSSQD